MAAQALIRHEPQMLRLNCQLEESTGVTADPVWDFRHVPSLL